MAAGKIHIADLTAIAWQPAVGADFLLPEGDTHVYAISIGKNLSFLNTLLALLTPSERIRANKYVRQADRVRYIIGHGVQRLVLGRYLNIAPGLIEFGLGINNKPYIFNDTDTNFNLSHSGDYILLAVSAIPVGCDVEYIDYNFSFAEILPNYFSTKEANYIYEATPHERFYKLWTRKEALLKGTGEGLNEYLSYTSALDGLHNMHHSLWGREYDWYINSFKIGPIYAASVAIAGAFDQLKFFDVDLSQSGLN